MRRIAWLALLLPAVASAQTWPSKPLRLIAASSPGSAVDIVSRIVAQKLSDQLGQQVVVDNRAGAGGNLGAELAAKAPPDGYNLFMGTPAQAINTGLYRKLDYDLVRDFAPVSLLTIGHYCVVVHPSLPVQSVKELIALAHTRRGQLNYASAGNGNATHLAGALFTGMAHIELVHVPYKGTGPALTDLIGGQVQIMFGTAAITLNQIRAGRLKPLGVSSAKRTPLLPEVPTIAESGAPGYEMIIWWGVLAPAATSAAVVSTLNREIGAILEQPEAAQRLAAEGAAPTPASSAEFAKRIAGELDKWRRVARDGDD